MAREAGFIVNHGKVLALTDEFLNEIDVFVLSITALTMTDDDKEALKRFLRRGGGIFILTYSRFWRPGIDTFNIGGFTGEFGIKFGAMSKLGSQQGTIVSGSILSGPTPAAIFRSPYFRSELNVDESLAKVQARLSSGKPLIAIAKLSGDFAPGKLLVHGDASMIAKEVSISEIDLADNRALAANIIEYFLNGGFDLFIKKTKLKGRNIVAGDTVKIVTKIKNLASGDSTPTDITHVLTEFSQVRGGPGDEIGTLGTSDVQSVKGNKKTKVTTVVTLPSNLPPGEYVVITTINVSDQNSENNIKSSKKFFVN
jgi:hypothetical protein